MPRDWKFENILKATGLIRSLGEDLTARVTMFVAFENEDTELSQSEAVENLEELLNRFPDEERNAILFTLEAFINVGRSQLSDLEAVLRSVAPERVLPNPDTFEVPDYPPF